MILIAGEERKPSDRADRLNSFERAVMIFLTCAWRKQSKHSKASKQAKGRGASSFIRGQNGDQKTINGLFCQQIHA